MITSITIENLRGIRQGTLEGLAPLTLLVGPNNSGKSTVLDALMIGANPDASAGQGFVVQRRSGMHQPERWLLWNRSGEAAERAILCVTTSDSRQATTELPPMNRKGSIQGISDVRFVDPLGGAPKAGLDQLVTLAVERGLMKGVTDLLAELGTGVHDVRILSQAHQPVVYLVSDTGALPEATAGDGIRMLLRVALELTAPPGSLELIEEPEMHMHPGAIRKIAQAMLAAVRRGIQLVVSTHSLDLIDFILGQCPEEEMDKVAVFRLALVDGVLKSTRYSGKEAQYSRTAVEEDLR